MTHAQMENEMQIQTPSMPPVYLPPRQDLLPWWKPAGEPASKQVLWTGAAAGLAAAALTPDSIGVGWSLAGLVGVAAVLLYVRRPGIAQSLWLAAALALLAVGAFRDAEWLYPLCVMGSMLCGSVAMAGGRSVLALAFGAIAIPLAALRAIPWVGRGLAKARPRNTRAILSVVVSLLLLLVFGSLLAGADATFNEFVQRLIPELDLDRLSWWIFSFVVAGFGAFGACYLVAAPPHIKEKEERKSGTLRPKDYGLPVAVLVLLFTGFLATQIAVMFGGHDYVMRTAGVTFAEYARSGFWQLLAITVLTLVIIGVVAALATRESTKDRMWLRGLLGALAALTLVIVASALSRMWFYQQAYGFTVLRLLVGACELWLGLVYLLVIAAGVPLRARWLPRAIIGTGVAFFLTLAFLNPEGFVASHNVARWKETGKIDANYLSTLSADAIPAVNELPEPLRSCSIWTARYTLRNDDDFRDWNLSRVTARELLAARPPVDICEDERYR